MKLKPDTLTDLVNPPGLTTLDKVLLSLYLQAEGPALSLRDLQALQAADCITLAGVEARLTPEGATRAEATRGRLEAWVDRILDSNPKAALAPPTSNRQAILQGGRSRNAAVRAYVRQCRRVRFSAILDELKLKDSRAAVKEYIRREPSLTMEGRGAEAFVCWVEATDTLLRLDRLGARIPYNPKRILDAFQAILTGVHGFLNFLPGVQYDEEDRPHPTLNVQHEVLDTSPVRDTETDWLLITAENLQVALEALLLGAATVFELREVKRDLRAWLQDEGAGPLPAAACLYLWQTLRTGRVTHKAIDRRKV